MSYIKYISNENFFNIIDTEEKSYFLGLLYADGNNYVNGNHSYEISIKLQIRDKDILEKFRDIISPNAKLKIIVDKQTGNQHSLLRIGSKKISQQLIELGCVPNKSLILEFPTFIDEKLLHHFIRGYSDGDGSIYSRKPTKNGHTNYHWQLTSTNKFCESVAKIIKNILDVHCSQSLAKPKTNKITSTLTVGGNLQVKKVLDWLYQDSTIYLDRKNLKYLEFIRYLDQTSSSKSSSSSINSSLGIETCSSPISKFNKSLIPSSDILNSVP